MMKHLTVVSLLMGMVIVAAAGFSQESGEPRYINLPGRTDDLPFSNAVLVGDTLYLAGAIGIDPDTGAPPPDIGEEVRMVLDNTKQRLEMVGMTMDDLVSVQVFCPDLSLYGEFNAIYRTYFRDHFPARAFIGSGPLLRGGHFEINGIAVKR
jgi:2-iminobutanoate/2-iminopropanoate deaminase